GTDRLSPEAFPVSQTRSSLQPLPFLRRGRVFGHFHPRVHPQVEHFHPLAHSYPAECSEKKNQTGWELGYEIAQKSSHWVGRGNQTCAVHTRATRCLWVIPGR